MLENLNYRIFGDGTKNIIFLHGWGCNLNYFNFAIPFLCNAKVISLDFPNFGESDRSNKPLDVYEYAFIIYKFLCDMNLNNIYIVGHSFGGRIAIILKAIFNLNIEKIILVDSAGLKPKFNLITYLKIKKYKTFKKLKIKQKNCGSSDYKELDGNMKISFVKIVNEHLNYLLKYINCETLIIWGTKDKTTPIYMAKKFKKSIKNSDVVFFNNCGHFSFLENKNKFILVLKSFCNI